MIKNFIIIIFTLFLVFSNPVYSIDNSSKSLDKYSKTIADKFSRSYCNTIQFGISNDGALRFAIGETLKEFKNNKLNSFIDYGLLKKKILLSLKNRCLVYDFPSNKLDKLKFE